MSIEFVDAGADLGPLETRTSMRRLEYYPPTTPGQLRVRLIMQRSIFEAGTENIVGSPSPPIKHEVDLPTAAPILVDGSLGVSPTSGLDLSLLDTADLLTIETAVAKRAKEAFDAS